MDCLRSIRKNRWKGPRKLKKITVLVVVTSFVLIVSFADTSDDCRFPAIYNFGDSNSDTGSVSATFGRVTLPNGRTFFGKPSGRYSDGRLLIDFIAEKLERPFLSAYLDALQPHFRNGANFAAAGSTIQPFDVKLLEAGFNPLTLNIQLSQFGQLKDRTNELYSQAKTSKIKSNLPIPEDFSKALYTLDIGQNDLHFFLTTVKVDQVKPSIPPIINQFALAIEKLYQEGARNFWIHNTGPIGCLPVLVIAYPPKPVDADQNGCIKSYNEIAREFNKQLKDRVSELRTQFEDALLLYVDIYSAKYTLISEVNKYGFVSPIEYCCGDHDINCWNTAIVNATNAVCKDASKYISWDSIHYSEAANHWIANRIVDGSFSDPSIPLNKACRKPIL